MPPFKKRINKLPEVEIKERFLQLYETVDELKDFIQINLTKKFITQNNIEN